MAKLPNVTAIDRASSAPDPSVPQLTTLPLRTRATTAIQVGLFQAKLRDYERCLVLGECKKTSHCSRHIPLFTCDICRTYDPEISCARVFGGISLTCPRMMCDFTCDGCTRTGDGEYFKDHDGVWCSGCRPQTACDKVSHAPDAGLHNNILEEYIILG